MGLRATRLCLSLPQTCYNAGHEGVVGGGGWALMHINCSGCQGDLTLGLNFALNHVSSMGHIGCLRAVLGGGCCYQATRYVP